MNVSSEHEETVEEKMEKVEYSGSYENRGRSGAYKDREYAYKYKNK